MIKLRNKLTGDTFGFTISKFPDGTSQVWQIIPEPEQHETLEVLWMFENEAELFHVYQLGLLLSSQYKIFATLTTPFLPYSRQDKKISNNSTFARHALISLIKDAGYTRISTYDSHSSHIMIESKEPRELLEAALPGHDMVCFPDKGALDRYAKLVEELSPGMPFIYANKVRNQLTGEITGLEIETNGHSLEYKNILVIDDICDGGKTFTELAKKLVLEPYPEYEPKDAFTISTEPIYMSPTLSLAVSHGIFSKGLKIVFDSGYNKVYTTNSLLKHNFNLPFGIVEVTMFHDDTLNDKFQVVEVIKL